MGQKLPDEINRGPLWLVRFCNDLRKYVLESTPRKGIGTEIVDGADGKAINASGAGAGGGASIPCIIAVYNSTSGEIEAHVVSIRGTDDGLFTG